MTTLAELRTAIKAKVAGVTGMGEVHGFERYLVDQKKLAELYVSRAQEGRRLYGWYLKRLRTAELLVDTGRNFRDVTWRLRGFMSIEDASETEILFDNQIEAMCDAFRADPRLGGICETTFKEANGNQAGLQLQSQEPVLFCGVLCHGATMSLITRVYTNT